MSGNGGYERSDLSVNVLFVAIVVLLGLMFAGIGVGFGIRAAFDAAEEEQLTTTHPMADFREKAKAPLLQANPTVEFHEHRAWELHTLTTYGWIDPKEGIVRIPINRAIKLTLNEGLPAREERK